MDWDSFLYAEGAHPLDRIVDGYSYTSIFRTIGFIGDSLSSGEFETRDDDGNPGYHDLYEYSWGQYIARKNGLKAYSFSRGGMTAKEYIDSFAEDKGFWDPDKACQAYVIALGVNDIYNFRYEVGAVTDFDKQTSQRLKPTVMAYYTSIVARYKEISPDAKFFFVTIPNNKPADFEEETLLFNRSLYELAAMFDNAYVIDLYQYGPAYDEKFRKHYYMYGHMTPSGYIFTAQLIDSYIDYYVRRYPQDFKTIGLVNSGIPFLPLKE
ncbi:MAG: SGNH/GDSL hydrolase family protein [Clostridia bacterium]|nr:SGNH/GDSL hydrolase family protein [Clostridia bacterium]